MITEPVQGEGLQHFDGHSPLVATGRSQGYVAVDAAQVIARGEGEVPAELVAWINRQRGSQF